MKKEMKEFFSFPTYRIGGDDQLVYYIHLQWEGQEGYNLFPNSAVVEAGDGGEMKLVDVDDIDYEDFEDFITAIIERYEGKI